MFYLHFLIQPLQETQDLRHNKKSMSVNPNLFVCVRTRVCVCASNWLSLNNSKTIKVVTLEFCSIQ